MKFALLLQTFEVIHPLLGFVPRAGFLPAAVIVFGRLFMYFAMIVAEPRMHTKPAVTYLFAVYTCIELVRYPYYMLKVSGQLCRCWLNRNSEECRGFCDMARGSGNRLKYWIEDNRLFS